jgi:hypothetical protein
MNKFELIMQQIMTIKYLFCVFALARTAFLTTRTGKQGSAMVKRTEKAWE